MDVIFLLFWRKMQQKYNDMILNLLSVVHQGLAGRVLWFCLPCWGVWCDIVWRVTVLLYLTHVSPFVLFDNNSFTKTITSCCFNNIVLCTSLPNLHILQMQQIPKSLLSLSLPTSPIGNLEHLPSPVQSPSFMDMLFGLKVFLCFW